eukprot:TRINITY_DN8306_c0_g2_i1.p1 TRINITY_DN8306_c0_g2~~TRINITY_DN8306_c0_g2_i1.p1  ORF type:complete len:134 (+),score=25.64 TRINITY_DN8306_c0_g2_i1:30-404(+)
MLQDRHDKALYLFAGGQNTSFKYICDRKDYGYLVSCKKSTDFFMAGIVVLEPPGQGPSAKYEFVAKHRPAAVLSVFLKPEWRSIGLAGQVVRKLLELDPKVYRPEVTLVATAHTAHKVVFDITA